MPLGAPNVVGPISSLNTEIVLEGQIVGAKIEIFADGILIADGTATWCRQGFALKSGKTLTAGLTITARQTLSSESSPPLACSGTAPWMRCSRQSSSRPGWSTRRFLTRR